MVIDEQTIGRVIVLTPRGRLTVETFGELKSRVGRLFSSLNHLHIWTDTDV